MKKKDNSGKCWTSTEIEKLIKLIKGNTPTKLIAYKMGRTKNAINSKAQDEKISLKPTNKSPYDRKYSNSKRKGKK